MRKRWLAILAACAPLAAGAQAQPLRVTGFAGSSSWPMLVAEEQRFFERENLAVELRPAIGSRSQLAELADGRVDIALTAMDNVVARGGETFAFLGVNNGGRGSLIVVPAVRSYGDLKGRPLAVDAPDSGYALVLMEMLARGGLPPGSYSLLGVGGSRERLAALRDGRAAGALLNAPADAAAEAAGLRRLGTSAEVLARYQGSVGAARRSWAAANADRLVRFIRAYVASVDWLYEPSHREAALELLARRLGASRRSAQRSYAELLDPEHGSLARRGALDIEGVRAVLELRRRFSRGGEPLGPPERYYDLGYYTKALNP
ncbi:MAG TPA: ABC transporter substrate-binding protein [Burkholderiales bacterium]|nr:ABC transporter substrate-binding protein [Burkholderiales bacterium]